MQKQNPQIGPGGLEAKIGDLIVLATQDGEYVAGFVRSTSPYSVEVAHQRFGFRNLSENIGRGHRKFPYKDFKLGQFIDRENLVKHNEPKNCNGKSLGDVNIGDLVVLMTGEGEYVAGFLKGQYDEPVESGNRKYLATISYQRFGHRNLSSRSNPGDRAYDLSKFLQYFVIDEATFNQRNRHPPDQREPQMLRPGS